MTFQNLSVLHTFRGFLKKLVKGYLRDFWWRHIYGKTIHNPPLNRVPASILFICKGNICRSPFAEHMAMKLSKENGLGVFTSRSAGLEALGSEKSPLEALAAGRTFGIDLSSHISRGLDFQGVSESDLIVAMEASHIKSLMKLYPDFRSKFFLLPLFEKDNLNRMGYLSYNTPDPYGKDVEVFRGCYERLTLALNEMLRTIYPPNG